MDRVKVILGGQVDGSKVYDETGNEDRRDSGQGRASACLEAVDGPDLHCVYVDE